MKKLKAVDRFVRTAMPEGVIVAACTMTDPERRKNARLFAAAPEMLTALKGVMPTFEWQNEVRIERGSLCWKRIEEAIAKAEGRNL